MKVTISFKKENPNELVQKYALYRSADKDSVYHEDNKISEIVDIPEGDVVTITDATAKLATEYWYGLQTVGVGGESYISVPKYVCRHANRGAFDKKVIIGDTRAGFCDYDYDSLNGILPALSKKLLAQGAVPPANVGSNITAGQQLVFVHGVYRGRDVIYIPTAFMYFHCDPRTIGATVSDQNKVFNDKVIPLLKSDTYFINGVEYKCRLIGIDEYNELFQYTCGVDTARQKPTLTSGLFTGGAIRGIMPTVIPTNAVVSTSEIVLMADENGDAVMAIQNYSNYNIGDTRIKLTTLRNNGEYFTLPLAFEPVQY